MTPLRLLAVIEAYEITGPAKNLLDFARLARAENIETTLATFIRGKITNLFIETVRTEGIPIGMVPERRAFDPAVPRALAELVRSLNPHVIQTHAVKSHFLARLARLPDCAPWVAFHHGYTWPTWRARTYNQLDRWSLRAARKVLTVSLPFRNELIARGVAPDRIEIVHNAIRQDWGTRPGDSGTAANLRAKLRIADGYRVLLIVGRLSLEKDHPTLLKAVAALRPRWKLHLVIVGEGPERPRIEDEISRLGLSGVVTLTGHQPSAEPYYGIADVAVLSSRTEGSPNALLEAMAAGVPVVATRVGGIPEIATHEENALLVEASDARQMAAAIATLMENTNLAAQLSARARQVVGQRFTPEARVSRLAGIYRSIARQ